jgi:hypothetical protein
VGCHSSRSPSNLLRDKHTQLSWCTIKGAVRIFIYSRYLGLMLSSETSASHIPLLFEHWLRFLSQGTPSLGKHSELTLPYYLERRFTQFNRLAGDVILLGFTLYNGYRRSRSETSPSGALWLVLVRDIKCCFSVSQISPCDLTIHRGHVFRVQLSPLAGYSHKLIFEVFRIMCCKSRQYPGVSCPCS